MQQTPINNAGNLPYTSKSNQGAAVSPALLMARKIRSEQGAESLKAFLSSVEPFISPGELKNVCAAFGLNYNALPGRGMRQGTFRAANSSNGNPKNFAGNDPAAAKGFKMNGAGNANAGMNQNSGSNINMSIKSGRNGVNGSQNTGGGAPNAENSINMNGNQNSLFNPSRQGNNPMMNNPMQLMQQLMQMQNLMNGGADMQKLFNLFGGR